MELANRTASVYQESAEPNPAARIQSIYETFGRGAFRGRLSSFEDLRKGGLVEIVSGEASSSQDSILSFRLTEDAIERACVKKFNAPDTWDSSRFNFSRGSIEGFFQKFKGMDFSLGDAAGYFGTKDEAPQSEVKSLMDRMFKHGVVSRTRKSSYSRRQMEYRFTREAEKYYGS